MRPSETAQAGAPQETRAGRGGASAGGERGVLMMFVLLVMLLISAITLSIMNIIAGDQAAGIHELQAVQVFNVAEAGVNYAIGKLQSAGADSYAGGTTAIMSGSTTLGTAAITVNCIDSGAAPPCGGTNASYRRIVSAGSLPVGGPSRTIVAVIQGYGLAQSPYAVCGYQSINAQTNVTITGDIGSNGSITLQNGATVNGDGNVPPQYTGLAKAEGTITCTVSCVAQIAGGITQNFLGWVCPTVTTGPFTPGLSNLTVHQAGFLMDSGTGYSWNNITFDAGKCNSSGKGLSTLQIQAPAGPTTVVNVNSITMNNCGRLMITGAGNVDLRIGAASGTGLSVGQQSHFGVLPADAWSAPVPVPAYQLLVEVTSSSSCSTSCAANFQGDPGGGGNAVAGGVYLVPNGEIQFGANGKIAGAVLANVVTFQDSLTVNYDTTAGIGAPVFIAFNNFRSWKDQ